ncbi:cellulose biosynthesis cyclic di-GMP-binding regulatory protein BcsB [Pseudooceanicola sp. CBS1P-1]|uniref:Cyclic di-GMP-binding protein n=1 Tax=Pseudooceanicola albus TaxID=2692189 RepID=A0A6L7G0X1_9RHOB|nr:MULTISPECIES: cellulose biosynthesis cyclic di-GMP-binding regulatory protein BcsB [Pseudooceanicola]MBT9385022.1 cellulose biosynthesis cyclic di-GMP-binding regulatory protein BcsB [Pseudooceanicola endophyticus]MXN17984.1 hypothetical protein [Pseudooceanicola albus]
MSAAETLKIGRGLGVVAVCAGIALAAAPQPLLAQQSEDSVPTVDLRPLMQKLEPRATASSDAAPAAATPAQAGSAGEMPSYVRGSGTDMALPTGAGVESVAPVQDVLLPMQVVNGPAIGANRIVRLSGERASRTFHVNVPNAEAANDLRLSYRISINVLPERSQIRVRVNGTEVDPIQPHAFTGFEPITLPKNLLVTGDNVIEVTVQESHRIFCGPDASFEIWTEFDLNNSGVTVTPGSLPLDSEGFAAALQAQLSLRQSIPVRLPKGSPPGILKELAQRLSALRNGTPVTLETLSPYDMSLAAAPIARISVVPGAAGAEIRRGADGAAVLVLSETPSGDGLDLRGLDEFLPAPGPVGDVAHLAPGTAETLRALKFTDLSTYNHYSEQQVAFRLPSDWLELSSQEGLLRLSYQFADGLPYNALMLVKVNGTTVRLLPLGQGGAGQMLPLLDVGFPARLMHPGVNQVTFEAMVPGDPADLPCPTYDTPLLTINPDSTLLVPKMPEMTTLDLRAPLAAVRPDQVSADGAAGSHAERTLHALETALRPIDGVTQIGSAALHVIDASSLDQLKLGALGLTRREFEEIFYASRPAALTQPIQDPSTRSWFMPAVRQTAAALAQNLRDLAKPGEGPLNLWLSSRKADAALVIPDQNMPDDMWLVLGPQVDPAFAAQAVAQARISAEGPHGRVALLNASDGTWSSWTDTSRPPVLHEPLTPRNFRAVAGNYASWSPFFFVAVLLGLTVISVIVALVFVISTRGARKQ